MLMLMLSRWAVEHISRWTDADVYADACADADAYTDACADADADAADELMMMPMLMFMLMLMLSPKISFSW